MRKNMDSPAFESSDCHRPRLIRALLLIWNESTNYNVFLTDKLKLCRTIKPLFLFCLCWVNTMSHLTTFKICDPLYDYIYFDKGEKALIEHKIFQRLRAIQQLGFADMAFPSGTHNRFSHSLGCAHLAGQAFDSIFEKNKKNFSLTESKKREFRKVVKMSALLHDVGHGPLSHFSEPLMPPLKALQMEKYMKVGERRMGRHEDYSLKMIMEKEEGLFNTIQKAGVAPEAVAQILHHEFKEKESRFQAGGLDFLPLFRQIISSDFDVDRMDYLQRDSLHCGVKYGLIDFIWLISHFDCHIRGNQVFLGIRKGGLYTLESFILGRQHMRLIVYFHHKSVIYNKMLKKYAEEVPYRLPASLTQYIPFTDSHLKDHLRKEHNTWAKKIMEQKPYIRLAEYVFFDSFKKKGFSQEEPEKLISLKQKLNKHNIPFIEINSEEDSLTPYKTDPAKDNTISLKSTNNHETKPLKEDPGFLYLPPRKIQRIYVPPHLWKTATSLL